MKMESETGGFTYGNELFAAMATPRIVLRGKIEVFMRRRKRGKCHSPHEAENRRANKP